MSEDSMGRPVDFDASFPLDEELPGFEAPLSEPEIKEPTIDSKEEENLVKKLDVFRKFVSKDPSYRPRLAETLKKLGELVEKSPDRIFEAEMFYREAFDVYRLLSNAEPDVYKPEYASIALKLARTLRQSGNDPDAEKAARAAGSLYRELSARDPRYKDPLLETVELMIQIFLDSERYPELEKAAGYALELQRERVQRGFPNAKEELVEYLNDLTRYYLQHKKLSEAEKYCREAATLTRELDAKTVDGQFARGITWSAWATLLEEHDKSDDAIKTRQNALTAFQTAVDMGVEDPARLLEYANETIKLGQLLLAKERTLEARENLRQGIELLQSIANDDLEGAQGSLFTALVYYVLTLNVSEDAQTLLTTMVQAIELGKKLYKKSPELYRVRWLLLLEIAPDSYVVLGRKQEAIDAQLDRVAIYREDWSEVRSPQTTSNLADSYHKLASLYDRLGHWRQAEQTYLEESQLRRELTSDCAEQKACLAQVLLNLGTLHQRMEKDKSAMKELKEARELFDGLSDRKGAFWIEIATCWGRLGVGAEKEWDDRAAIDYYEKACSIWIALEKRNPGRYKVNVVYSIGLLFKLYDRKGQKGAAKEIAKVLLPYVQELAIEDPGRRKDVNYLTKYIR